MCEAGRIKHHLKHNLWRPESSVVFVGYQAQNTLGRRIKDGEKVVKIFGEDIGVRCNIYSIDGFSGHADQKGLLDWVGAFKHKPSKVFLVHGEEYALNELSRRIKMDYGIQNEIMKLNQSVELSAASHKSIVAEEAGVRKESLITALNAVKSNFGEAMKNMEQHLAEGENVKLDVLQYLLEKLQQDIDDLDKKIG
jgi:metallo-beta-lactamase family protein